jgi:hypothetical protein
MPYSLLCRYVAEIEASVLNGVISQIPLDGRGIRQFALLHKVKTPPPPPLPPSPFSLIFVSPVSSLKMMVDTHP